VNAAHSREARVFQAGNRPEDARLLRPGQLGLKAHQIEKRAGGFFPAQLDDRKRPQAGVRMDEPHRLHRTEGQRVFPPRGQHLHREAAFKVPDVFKLSGGYFFTGEKLPVKTPVLFFRQGTVQVVRRAPVVALRPERFRHLDGLRLHNGSDGVVEVEIGSAQQLSERKRQCVGGERAGGENDRFPVGNFRDFLPA